MRVGGKTNYAAGGSVAPNRAQAYTAARKAEGPQKGLSYPELLVDNILGLDNDYLSYGEKFGQGFNKDEIGTLKNVAAGAYEGAKKAVTQPITTAEELLFGIYDSVSNLATEDLDARLTRMFGVGYQDATGEQVNKAREAVIGDALTAAELVPLGMAAKKRADVAGEAVDAAQKAQYERFVDRNTPDEFFDSALGKQFYYPSQAESDMMDANPTPEEQEYIRNRREAEFLEQQGLPSSTILDMTGMLPVPLRTPVGEDFGTRMVAAMTPEEMAAIRPERAQNYGIVPEEVDMQTGIMGAIRKLRGKPAPYGGWYDPGTKQIKINKDVPEDYKSRIVEHEMTHADLDFSQLDRRGSEAGANSSEMARQKAQYLKELGRLSRSATDKDERNFFRDLQNKVRNTTAIEFYYLNPGEALARLAEGDDSRDVRLSALETFNPRLNPQSLPRRGLQSLATGLFSETNRLMSPLQRDFPEATGTLTRDYYARVPMDLSKLVVNDPSYEPRNPSLPWTPASGTPDPFRNVGPAPDVQTSASKSPYSSSGLYGHPFLDSPEDEAQSFGNQPSFVEKGPETAGEGTDDLSLEEYLQSILGREATLADEEFLQALADEDFEGSYASGGIVKGSSLDLDIFEPIPLY